MGFEGYRQPNSMGSGVAPWKILVLDPMLGWADLPMVLCMFFAHRFGRDGFSVHGFGRDGFWSMVLDALACINMYCKHNEKSSW